MKFNYTYILLFSLSLNILLLSSQVYNQRNHNLTLHKPTTTSRLLCECELYARGNYDNDPEMKALMQDFDRQTSQRFKEYDERMIKNRQKCRDQCDKEIQKIILEDKIEKELIERLATLEKNITTENLPTCECEKSVAHKMENTCLGCAGVLGGGIAPSVRLFGEVALGAWKTAALAAAKEFAEKAGAAKGLAAGTEAGINAVMSGLEALYIDKLGIGQFESFFTTKYYIDISKFSKVINVQYDNNCGALSTIDNPMCNDIGTKLNLIANIGEARVEPLVAIEKKLTGVVAEATEASTQAAKTTSESVTATITKQKTSQIAANYMSYQTTITASIVAILTKKENEEKTPIHKIIKRIDIWFHDIKFNLMFCEFQIYNTRIL
ncbi:PIR protein, putative [Plasmodium sp.]|nr:PIR protein, putative [Plasmodium sp.]